MKPVEDRRMSFPRTYNFCCDRFTEAQIEKETCLVNKWNRKANCIEIYRVFKHNTPFNLIITKEQ